MFGLTWGHYWLDTQKVQKAKHIEVHNEGWLQDSKLSLWMKRWNERSQEWRTKYRWSVPVIWFTHNSVRWGEKVIYDANQLAFCNATTLFTESGQVWNKGLNWPVCAEFRCSNSVESNSSFYHPPTKLREGNVFIGVCQSFCSKEGGVGDNRGYGWQASGTHPTGMLSC